MARVRFEVQRREIAWVKTGIAFFDYQQRKIAECPQGFKERFGIQEESV